MFDETFSFTLPAKNKSVYSPGSVKLSSSDVQSLLEDRGDAILKVLLYDSDTLSSDLLGQSEINLSDQPDAFVRIEGLGSLSRGMPYAMVDSKTGREQGTVHLAFAATKMYSTVGESARLPVDATMSPSLSPPTIRGPGNREGGAADLTAPLAVVPKAGSKDAATCPSLSPPPVRGPGNRGGGAADLTAPLAVVPKVGSKVDPSSHAKAPEVTMQVYVRVFGISGFKSTAGWMDKTGFNVVVVLSYVQFSCRSEHHIMYMVYDTRLVLRFFMCDRSFRQARSWQRSTQDFGQKRRRRHGHVR